MILGLTLAVALIQTPVSTDLTWNPTIQKLAECGLQPVGRMVTLSKPTFTVYIREGKWQQFVEQPKGKYFEIGMERPNGAVGPVLGTNNEKPQGFPSDFEVPDKLYIPANAFKFGPYAVFRNETLASVMGAVMGGSKAEETDEVKNLKAKLEDGKLMDKLRPYGENGVWVDLRVGEPKADAAWLAGTWQIWSHGSEEGMQSIAMPPGEDDGSDELQTLKGTLSISKGVVKFKTFTGKLQKAGERWLAKGKLGTMSLFPQRDDANKWLYITFEGVGQDGTISTKTASARKMNL